MELGFESTVLTIARAADPRVGRTWLPIHAPSARKRPNAQGLAVGAGLDDRRARTPRTIEPLLLASRSCAEKLSELRLTASAAIKPGKALRPRASRRLRPGRAAANERLGGVCFSMGSTMASMMSTRFKGVMVIRLRGIVPDQKCCQDFDWDESTRDRVKSTTSDATRRVHSPPTHVRSTKRLTRPWIPASTSSISLTLAT